MLKVSAEFVLGAIAAGLKSLAIEGGATTSRLADAVPPLPPCVEVTGPVVLFFVPAVVPVTFTENVHVVLAPKVAPDKLTVPAPAAAEIAPPPQFPVAPFGFASATPIGRASVNPIPLKPVDGFAF
jgi:hypothetical protein